MKNKYQNENELIINSLLNECISFNDSNSNGKKLIAILIIISSNEKILRYT